MISSKTKVIILKTLSTVAIALPMILANSTSKVKAKEEVKNKEIIQVCDKSLTQEELLKKAKEAVYKAKNTRIEEDIINAEECVSGLNESNEKEKLSIILQDIAPEFYVNKTKKTLMEAWVLTKENKDAKNKIEEILDALEKVKEGQEKEYLIKEVDKLQNFMDNKVLLQDVKKVMQELEGNKDEKDRQALINKAKRLVNKLDGSIIEEKSGLKKRLEEKQETIDKNIKDINTKIFNIKSKMDMGEVISEKDLKDLTSLVNNYKGDYKKLYNFNIELIKSYVDKVKAKNLATLDSKDSIKKSRDSVKEAKKLVDNINLDDIKSFKSAQNNINDARVNVYNLKNDNSKIEINDKETIIIKDERKKQIDKLNQMQNNLNNKLNKLEQQTKYAIDFFYVAEQSGKESALKIAEDKLDKLNNDLYDKASIDKRIKDLKNEMLKKAERVTKKLEINRRYEDIKKARNLISKIKDINVVKHEEFTKRINTVEACLLMEKAEKSKLKQDLDKVLDMCDSFNESLDEKKQKEIFYRRDQLELYINIKNSINELNKEISDGKVDNKDKISILRNLIKSCSKYNKELSDELDKTNKLLIDMNDKIKSATDEVEKAEKDKDKSSYDNALNKVNNLPKNVEDKASLQNRLNQVSLYFNLKEKLGNLKDKVDNFNIIEKDSLSKIEALLEKYTYKEDKQKIKDSFNNIKKESKKLEDELEDAKEGLKKARSSKKENDINKAEKLIKKIKNKIYKQKLENDLNQLKEQSQQIKKQEKHYNDLKKVIDYIKKAEKSLKKYDYEKAVIEVLDLEDGREKTELIQRLNKLDRVFDDLYESNIDEEKVIQAKKIIKKAKKTYKKKDFKKAHKQICELENSKDKDNLLDELFKLEDEMKEKGIL